MKKTGQLAKVILFTLFLTVFAVNASAQKVTLSFQNETFEKVLNSIKQQTGLSLVFSEQLVDLNRKVSINVNSVEVDNALKQLLANTNLGYEIKNNKLYLVEKKNAEQKNSISTSKKISGLVTDEKGDPIIGATIIVKGSDKGTVSDIDGKFELEIPYQSSMVVSYVGYKHTTISTDTKNNYKIILEEDTKILNEVVVVAYGTQQKKDLTGSVGIVDTKEMKKNLSPNIGQALQGLVSGVSVSTSGAPGTGADIRIRGVGSFSNVGPLYVIDGMILTAGQREFNVNDIETMQVLKDAAATALYGARGANGVILITTKKGKEGIPRIDFSANYGAQQIANRIEMMNSLEFLRVNRQAYKNASMNWPGEPRQGQVLINTDWQDEFFKPGDTQDYNLTISGGNKDGNFLISANVFSQDGVVKGPYHNRYAFRVNTEIKKGKFTFGENMLFSRTQTKPMIGSPFIDLCRLPPVIPVKDENGKWGTGSTLFQTYGTNPIGLQETRDFLQTSNRVLGNIYTEAQITKDLKFKSNLGVEFHAWNDREKSTFEQIRYLEVSNYENSLTERRGDFTTLILENILSYNKVLDKHKFDVLAGYTVQETKWKQMTSNVNNVVPGFWVLSAGNKDISLSGSDSEYAMISMLGRLNYAYDDKYLLQLNVRRDGSSRFGKNYRYGIFPSASLGWRISQEKFFGNIKKSIDDLKLRASYGTIGDQQAIGDYDYSTYISVGEGSIFGADQAINMGAIQKGRANPNLRWESKTTLNMGLDFSALNNKLYGSFDFFSADSKNILVKLPISWTEGTDVTPWSNFGCVNNKGFELTLGVREQKREFKYNISVNLSRVKNKILALGESYREGGINGINRSEEGRSVGDFYVIKTDGIFQNQDEIFAHTFTKIDNATGDETTTLIQPNAKPGDIRYKDINNDGKISKDDRVFVGSPFPNYELGFQMSFEYRNFDLSMFAVAVFGNKIYNNTKYWLERMDETANLPAGLMPWTEEHPSLTTPRAVMGPNDNTISYSDRWIEAGDYARLKNLQIGYNFSEKILKRSRIIQNCRLFAGIQNLFTLTKYSGFDPEISGGDIFGKGNDNGHFPPVRSFNTGVQISF